MKHLQAHTKFIEFILLFSNALLFVLLSRFVNIDNPNFGLVARIGGKHYASNLRQKHDLADHDTLRWLNCLGWKGWEAPGHNHQDEMDGTAILA